MSTEKSIITTTSDTALSFSAQDTVLTQSIYRPMEVLESEVKDLKDRFSYLESRVFAFESEFINFLHSGYFRGQQFRPNPNQPYQPNPQTLNQPAGYPTFADLDKIKDRIAEVEEQVHKINNEVENIINY